MCLPTLKYQLESQNRTDQVQCCRCHCEEYGQTIRK